MTYYYHLSQLNQPNQSPIVYHVTSSSSQS